MKSEFLLVRGVVILGLLLYFSMARAADVPDWWIGSDTEYESLVKAASNSLSLSRKRP